MPDVQGLPEMTPLRASGNYAGSKCHIRTCQNYARFVVGPAGMENHRRGICGHHLSAMTKTLQILTRKVVVVQEVPGNWGRELIVVGDQIGRLPGPQHDKVEVK